MTAVLEVRNLRKTYKNSNGNPVEAVKGINFQIQKGEIFSLLGPNGAGKSTTINMISGLIEPTEGDAEIGGFSIKQDPIKAKQLIGVIPQEVALYLDLNARQNLEFFGKLYGLRGSDLHRRVDEVLEFIDLVDRQKDKLETFSGGMKRRVNIGVGLLHRPELLFMDEPTVGIDPQNRRRILDTVFRLRDEYGLTVLYTTHLMEEAQELSDRVGIIDHGELIALGTQGELTQEVGEEDRLVFQVGEQTIEDELLRRIEQDVDTVTRALFTPSEQVSDGESMSNPGVLTVFALRGRKALPDIINMADDAGIEIDSVEVLEPNLEAVFLQLTGRALRD